MNLLEFFEKVDRRLSFYSGNYMYRKLLEGGWLGKPANLFDYNSIIRERKSPYIEKYSGNGLYGIGFCFRQYSGYKGRLYCATEHSIQTLRRDNYIETKEHGMPIVLTPSTERRRLIQGCTDKLVISYGPHFLPYTEACMSDFMVKCLKKNLGRTLVVFPQHNNVDSEYLKSKETRTDLIQYVNDLKEKYHYQTVLVCNFFADIENGTYLDYEQADWKVVTAGRNTSYDFPAYMKVIYQLADFVVSQGGYSSIIQAVYMDKPALFLKGESYIKLQNGKKENQEESLKLDRIYMECLQLFHSYSENISEEQRSWCEKWGGFSSVCSPEELYLMFQFAERIRRNYKDDNFVVRMANKKCYQKIRQRIMEAVELRKKEGDYHVQPE